MNREGGQCARIHGLDVRRRQGLSVWEQVQCSDASMPQNELNKVAPVPVGVWRRCGEKEVAGAVDDRSSTVDLEAAGDVLVCDDHCSRP